MLFRSMILLDLKKEMIELAENKQVFLGYVIGLDYKNPHLSPFDEFQRTVRPHRIVVDSPLFYENLRLLKCIKYFSI